jgi:hypothetical protein
MGGGSSGDGGANGMVYVFFDVNVLWEFNLVLSSFIDKVVASRPQRGWTARGGDEQAAQIMEVELILLL